MCILLVEDEFLIRDLAHLLLTQAGYEVLEAEHGRAAYNHLTNHPGKFTCLVTDHNMPGRTTGAHIIRYMRRRYSTIPMILTTAFPQATTHLWRQRYGVELLRKPYEPDNLVQLVRRLLPIKPTRVLHPPSR